MHTLNQILSKLGQLFNWWVTVAPWEQALRIRLGKHVTLLKAGIHLRIPWIDRVYRQSIRVRTADLEGVQTVTTRDGHAVTASGNIKYQIDDIHKLYDTLHHAEDTVIDLTMAAIAQFVSTHDKDEISPVRVESFAEQEINLGRYGLGNVEVNVTDFAFTPTFRLIQDSRRYPMGDDLNTYTPDRASN